MAALGLGEGKDPAVYLGKALEAKPNDDALIRIGRLATTLKLDNLVERVRQEFVSRDLSVHLYPI